MAKEELPADGRHATGVPRAGVRARVSSLRGGGHQRRRGGLGTPEILALAASALLLFAAVGSYLFLLRPQRARLLALGAERATLEAQLQSARGSVTEGQDTQASVREILSSMQTFEIEHLGPSGSGSTNVIEELNRLIRKNNLRISGGLAFTQLEEAVPGQENPGGPRQPQGQPRGTAGRVVQSVYPGIGITLTVEGSYPSLRRFIREVESDRQFVVVDSVELEGVTDTAAVAAATGVTTPAVAAGGAAATAPAARPSGQRGTLVSLRLDMAAYFRRAGAALDATPLGAAGGSGR